jgi:hypothetical protein
VCLEHYIASKSFAAFRKTFSNACTYREVPNKKTVHRLEAKFRNADGGVWLREGDGHVL